MVHRHRAVVNDEHATIGDFTQIVRDSTEQHNSAEALCVSEENLCLLIEGASKCAIFSMSPVGDVTSWIQALKGFQPSRHRDSEKPVYLLYSEADTLFAEFARL